MSGRPSDRTDADKRHEQSGYDPGTMALAISMARRAINDAMPPESFPDPGDPAFGGMTEARNAAGRAYNLAFDEIRKVGMDMPQIVRAWHSMCSDCLFCLESAVMAYGRQD